MNQNNFSADKLPTLECLNQTLMIINKSEISTEVQHSLASTESNLLISKSWKNIGTITGSAPGRGESLFLNVDGANWVLRPYRRGGLAAKVSEKNYLWCGLENTRAFKEFRLTQALFERDLPVPKPVAAIVVKHNLTYEAGLITQRIKQSLALADCLTGASDTLLTEVGKTIRRFHDAGLDHVDLNARNILVSGDGKVWLIDFDRCKIRASGNWKDDNLARFKRSVLKFSPEAGEQQFSVILSGYKLTLNI